MAPAPKWLGEAIDDMIAMTHEERENLAERILQGLPRQQIADAITRTAAAQLASRGIRDASHDLARMIGCSAASTVEFLLRGLFDEEAG
jgi:hypothetical protein